MLPIDSLNSVNTGPIVTNPSTNIRPGIEFPQSIPSSSTLPQPLIGTIFLPGNGKTIIIPDYYNLGAVDYCVRDILVSKIFFTHVSKIVKDSPELDCDKPNYKISCEAKIPDLSVLGLITEQEMLFLILQIHKSLAARQINKAKYYCDLLERIAPDRVCNYKAFIMSAYLTSENKDITYTEVISYIKLQKGIYTQNAMLSKLGLLIARFSLNLEDLAEFSIKRELSDSSSSAFSMAFSEFRHRAEFLQTALSFLGRIMPEYPNDTKKLEAMTLKCELALNFYQREFNKCIKQCETYSARHDKEDSEIFYLKLLSLFKLKKDPSKMFKSHVQNQLLTEGIAELEGKKYKAAFETLTSYILHEHRGTVQTWIFSALVEAAIHVPITFQEVEFFYVKYHSFFEREGDNEIMQLYLSNLLTFIMKTDHSHFEEAIKVNENGIKIAKKAVDRICFRLANACAYFRTGNLNQGELEVNAALEDVVNNRCYDNEELNRFISFFEEHPLRNLEFKWTKTIYENHKSECALMGFASAIQRLGQHAFLVEILEGYLSLQKAASFDVTFALGSAYMIINNFQKATNFIQLAHHLNPRDNNTKILMAEIHMINTAYTEVLYILNGIPVTDRIANLLLRASIETNQMRKASKLMLQYGYWIDSENSALFNSRIEVFLEKRKENDHKEFKKAKVSVPIEPIKTSDPVAVTTPSQVKTMSSSSPSPTAPTGSFPAEPIRNKVKQGPVHHQPASKGDVTNLDPKSIFRTDLKQLASTFKGACTFDQEIYGIRPKVVERPISAHTIPVSIEQRLWEMEFRRLEVGRQAIVRIGDLLAQETVYCTGNQHNPTDYLYPLNIGYQILKLMESLAPTSKNAKTVSDVFKSTIQTHILSVELINRMRYAVRHDYHMIDFKKFKTFCQKLDKSTVLANVMAYRECAAPNEKIKEKSVVVEFQLRTNIEKRQHIRKEERKIDYLAEAQYELDRLGKIGDKSIQVLGSEQFYSDGVKMAICNIEECLKRLDVPDDKILREFFYFGNKIGHEIGEAPELYVNEEIPLLRMHSILQKASVISNRIAELVKG